MPLFKPALIVRSIYDIDPRSLHEAGIKGIIIDWKHTIISDNNGRVRPALQAWLNQVHTVHGIRVIIVSNSKPPVGPSTEILRDIPALFNAKKPSKKAFRAALDKLGTEKNETAVIGNGIVTDLWGGNRLGLYTIFVSRPRILGTVKRLVVHALKF